MHALDPSHIHIYFSINLGHLKSNATWLSQKLWPKFDSPTLKNDFLMVQAESLIC